MNQEIAGTLALVEPIRPPGAIPDRPDSLSDALLFIAAFHGRVVTRDALLSGLPIDDNRLSLALLARAARRAGLEVEPVKRAIRDIPAAVLPAILVFHDQSARVLIDIDEQTKKLTLVDPTTHERIEILGIRARVGLFRLRLFFQACRGNRCANGRRGRGSQAPLVLGRRVPVRGELHSRRHSRVHRQCAGARHAAFHDERL